MNQATYDLAMGFLLAFGGLALFAAVTVISGLMDQPGV